MAKSKKKIFIVSAVVLITLFFILPTIGFGVLKWGVLPPEKLTPLVIQKTNEFLDAHLECEKVELTYFETYPHLGIRLTNGRLISHLGEDSTMHKESLHIPSDSLLSFHNATISLRPTDYLFGGKITIGEVIIDNPRFYGFVNKAGRTNWDIYHNENDSTSTDNDNKKSLPPIDLQKVRISNGHFTYDDRQQDVFTEIKGFFLNIDGSLTKGENTLDIETGTSSILFRSQAYTLQNKLALKLKSRLQLGNNYNTITLKNAELLINSLPFTADGSIITIPDSKRMRIDMDMGLKISDMNDLLKFIPDAYFQNREKMQAKGSIILDGNIHGEFGDSITPSVNLCCKINDGSYHISGIKQGIDSIQMDLDIHLNGQYPDSSYISLEELTVKGQNTSFNMNGKVTNVFKNPAINTQIKGQVDFTHLAKEFLNPDTLLLEGKLEADLKAIFTVNDILNSRYGKVQAAGILNIDHFKAFSKPLDMDMYIVGTRFFIGSTKNESKYLNKKGLLNATLAIDTMNITYKDDINTKIRQLEMQANTTPVIDTTAVIPLVAGIKFDHLSSRLPDSVWVIAGHTSLQGGMKASATNKRIPTIAATINVDTLKYFMSPIRTGAILTGSQFNIEALPYREAAQQRRLRSGNSQQVVRKRTKTTSQAKQDSLDYTNKLLRKWEARGNVSFKQLRAFSHLFPVPMHMEQTSVKFDTNTATLTDARLHLGKSDLKLSGEINHIRQAMLRGRKLTGNFNLTSDYIDCNQLMKALNNGMQYAEQHPVSSELTALSNGTITNMNTQDIQATVTDAETDSTDQLFILPANIDVTLHTNAKRIDFKDLALENVQGEVILRDQSVNLSNLNMHSNMGCGTLTMVYTAKNKQGATAGFDLDLEQIQVEKLISLYPAIDTLVPMLRSFEGVVDCQVTATCKIDSTMSVILPSLNSACYLHGKNMVLLDGETFTEISKTLMFKNKKRNMIDSISVDLAIHDDKIEVFPFLVEMDRYKVAVGGTHNLDMTFDYHISVLKSPVPFKLGIDIKGNLDDFKYKIVKCKYKDFLKPAKQAELDSTRTNIRHNIREAIRKQIKEAAPELAGSLVAEHVSTHIHAKAEELAE
ncbi:AsmA-like C-terminal region-containing protein [Parabacteroides chinchillae]|uniref:AsmA-like C-terminal region n=1 Tax=Parabacteroides chinchillae TaxID=871327 RepID=A0A8G2BXA4_9BACT|nr:AsmA-like C-terminal region-containing protein [Parabacteroides chinchillae]SEF93599.1 AsmA-like C-terminal region [Parabacteroides chinchillae]